MAKNPPVGDGHRHGQVMGRSQTYNPHNDRWIKKDTETGKFIDQKVFQGCEKGKVDLSVRIFCLLFSFFDEIPQNSLTRHNCCQSLRVQNGRRGEEITGQKLKDE